VRFRVWTILAKRAGGVGGQCYRRLHDRFARQAVVDGHVDGVDCIFLFLLGLDLNNAATDIVLLLLIRLEFQCRQLDSLHGALLH